MDTGDNDAKADEAAPAPESFGEPTAASAWLGDLGIAIVEFKNKPTHLINFALTAIGLASTAKIVAHVFVTVPDSTFKEFAKYSLLALLSATFVHVMLIYYSLMIAEEDEEFREKFKPWTDTWGDISLRYLAVILLLTFCSKMGLEPYLEDLEWVNWLYAVNALTVFLVFLVWSSFAVATAQRKENGRRNWGLVDRFMWSDGVALAHWFLVILAALTVRPWAIGIAMLASVVYLLLIMALRLGVWHNKKIQPGNLVYAVLVMAVLIYLGTFFVNPALDEAEREQQRRSHVAAPAPILKSE